MLRNWVLVCPLLLLSSCITPRQAVREVDEEAYGIVGDKQEIVRGERHRFTIEPKRQRIMASVIDPSSGLVRPESTLHLDLKTILEIAAINSREFQTQKERLFTAAMSLMRDREDFRNSPFGTEDASIRRAAGTESVSSNTEFGVTNLLETGGSYAVSLGLDFLRFVSSPTSESASSFLNLSLNLPFLRNAGRQIVIENLRQSDRSTLYALRSFERFKKTYGVNVITSYLRVVSQVEQIEIAVANYESLQRARQEIEERYKEGRVSRVEVDQNLQAELTGENDVVNARQNLQDALDRLKDLLGLPIDLRVTVEESDLGALDALIAEDFSLEESVALDFALRARLDFRNAVDAVADAGRRVTVSENQLLPNFGLLLNARPVSKNLRPLKFNLRDGTYSAALDIDFALDRDIESINLKTSLIALQQAIRNQEDFREGVKLDVRAALRNLRQASDNYRITKLALDLAEGRVDSTKELRLVGRATTRDFLESQDSLVRSRNSLVNRKVDYRIAYLQLFRDTGALVVRPEGLDHDASRNLLLGK